MAKIQEVHGFIRFTDNTTCPKYFEGPDLWSFLNVQNAPKVLVPLSKLSVSKNVWFTNARLGPLDFIHSEMLKRGMGGSGPSGKQPLGSTISGAGLPLGTTNPVGDGIYMYLANGFYPHQKSCIIMLYPSIQKRILPMLLPCRLPWKMSASWSPKPQKWEISSRPVLSFTIQFTLNSPKRNYGTLWSFNVAIENGNL